jgi:hypothetical protein
MQCRFPVTVLLFLTSIVLVHPRGLAQQPQPNAPAAAGSMATPPVAESKLAPDAAVITLHGLCGNVSLPGSSPDATGSQTAAGASDASAPLTTPNPNCKTVITRQQYEDLIKEANPRADPQLARSFARDYTETVMFARKAVETGLDKDPAYQALLQYKYEQALYSIFKTSVKQKVNQMSDAELEKFYNANLERYEQFGLLRIHVPDVKVHHPAPGSSVQPKFDTAADQAAMKALAEKIRAEAVAGGDFVKLQAKAYKVAGETDDPPDPDLGDKWTRDTFPPEQLSAMLALKPGEVSQPLHNESGWHILKMVSRRTMPWSEAHDFTRQMIVADRANAIRKAIKAEYNDQYFVSAASREDAGSAK